MIKGEGFSKDRKSNKCFEVIEKVILPRGFYIMYQNVMTKESEEREKKKVNKSIIW